MADNDIYINGRKINLPVERIVISESSNINETTPIRSGKAFVVSGFGSGISVTLPFTAKTGTPEMQDLLHVYHTVKNFPYAFLESDYIKRYIVQNLEKTAGALESGSDELSLGLASSMMRTLVFGKSDKYLMFVVNSMGVRTLDGTADGIALTLDLEFSLYTPYVDNLTFRRDIFDEAVVKKVYDRSIASWNDTAKTVARDSLAAGLTKEDYLVLNYELETARDYVTDLGKSETYKTMYAPSDDAFKTLENVGSQMQFQLIDSQLGKESVVADVSLNSSVIDYISIVYSFQFSPLLLQGLPYPCHQYMGMSAANGRVGMTSKGDGDMNALASLSSFYSSYRSIYSKTNEKAKSGSTKGSVPKIKVTNPIFSAFGIDDILIQSFQKTTMPGTTDGEQGTISFIDMNRLSRDALVPQFVNANSTGIDAIQRIVGTELDKTYGDPSKIINGKTVYFDLSFPYIIDQATGFLTKPVRTIKKAKPGEKEVKMGMVKHPGTTTDQLLRGIMPLSTQNEAEWKVSEVSKPGSTYVSDAILASNISTKVVTHDILKTDPGNGAHLLVAPGYLNSNRYNGFPDVDPFKLFLDKAKSLYDVGAIGNSASSQRFLASFLNAIDKTLLTTSQKGSVNSVALDVVQNNTTFKNLNNLKRLRKEIITVCAAFKALKHTYEVIIPKIKGTGRSLSFRIGVDGVSQISGDGFALESLIDSGMANDANEVIRGIFNEVFAQDYSNDRISELMESEKFTNSPAYRDFKSHRNPILEYHSKKISQSTSKVSFASLDNYALNPDAFMVNTFERHQLHTDVINNIERKYSSFNRVPNSTYTDIYTSTYNALDKAFGTDEGLDNILELQPDIKYDADHKPIVNVSSDNAKLRGKSPNGVLYKKGRLTHSQKTMTTATIGKSKSFHAGNFQENQLNLGADGEKPLAKRSVSDGSANAAIPGTSYETASDLLSDAHVSGSILKEFRNNYIKDNIGFRKALPTFKVYFIEEDSELGNWKLLDDFYDVNGVDKIKIIEERNNPIQHAFLSIINPSKSILTPSSYYTGEPEDITRAQKAAAAGPNLQAQTSKKKATPDQRPDENLSRFTELFPLKHGTKIMIKLGYEQDPNNLTTKFIGFVSEIMDGDMITITAQSFGAEFVIDRAQEEKTIAQDSPELYGITVARSVLMKPTCRHFGRWKVISDKQFSQTATTNMIKQIQNDRTFIKQTLHGQATTTHSESSLLRRALVAWGSISESNYDENITLPFVPEQEKDDNVNPISYQNSTSWLFLKELELRYPGTVVYPLPYGDGTEARMTLFVGHPTGQYARRDFNLAERLNVQEFVKTKDQQFFGLWNNWSSEDKFSVDNEITDSISFNGVTGATIQDAKNTINSNPLAKANSVTPNEILAALYTPESISGVMSYITSTINIVGTAGFSGIFDESNGAYQLTYDLGEWYKIGAIDYVHYKKRGQPAWQALTNSITDKYSLLKKLTGDRRMAAMLLLLLSKLLDRASLPGFSSLNNDYTEFEEKFSGSIAIKNPVERLKKTYEDISQAGQTSSRKVKSARSSVAQSIGYASSSVAQFGYIKDTDTAPLKGLGDLEGMFLYLQHIIDAAIINDTTRYKEQIAVFNTIKKGLAAFLARTDQSPTLLYREIYKSIFVPVAKFAKSKGQDIGFVNTTSVPLSFGGITTAYWSYYLAYRLIDSSLNPKKANAAYTKFTNTAARANGRYKTFRQYHVADSFKNMIVNNMKVTEQNVFNTVVLDYLDTDYFSPDATQKIVKLNSNMPEWKVRPYSFKVNGSISELEAEHFASAMLEKQVQRSYTGNIVVVGNPDWKPYDYVYLNDIYRDMKGFVEIHRAIHTVSKTGYLVDFTPSLCTSFNDIINPSILRTVGANLVAIQAGLGSTSYYFDYVFGDSTAQRKALEANYTKITGDAAPSLDKMQNELVAASLGKRLIVDGGSFLAKGGALTLGAMFLPAGAITLVVASAIAVASSLVAYWVMGRDENKIPIILHPVQKSGKPYISDAFDKIMRNNITVLGQDVADMHNGYQTYLNAVGDFTFNITDNTSKFIEETLINISLP